jgi:tRNA A-37 threonylcarbamoyl transferase component Bud32
MGVVYEARQTKLQRLVALKMIRDGCYASAEQRARFLIEARAAAQLKHRHIVQIYEVGERHGLPYLAMEFVDGGDLSRKLAQTPQPVDSAAQVVEMLARAVHVAHQQGIVHRDLKPANILLAPSNSQDGVQVGNGPSGLGYYEPKIADFGLAKKQGEATELTETGAIMGTPSYMAPEQAKGRTKEIGPRTDVYALGAILYELLTGHPPFKGETAEDTLEQVRSQEPVPPRRLRPKLPRPLETVCLKCLKKEPVKRYADAEALAEDLGRFLHGEPIQAQPVRAWERGWKWTKRRPSVAALLLVGIVAVLASVGLVVASVYNTRLDRYNTQLDEARKAEEELRKRAERLRYAYSVPLAHRLWQAGLVQGAEQLLDDCPHHLRDWEWRYLKRLCHLRLLSFDKHTSHVRSIAISPGGRNVASASVDGTIRIWNSRTGTEVCLPLQGRLALTRCTQGFA